MANFDLTEKEYQELLEETERRMLGLPPPSDVDSFKVQQGTDYAVGSDLSAVMTVKPPDKVLRHLILVHGGNAEAIRKALLLLGAGKK